ncbi:MAG: helicase-related protein [Pseudomonadota bacterium]
MGDEPSASPSLPIDGIRRGFEGALADGPVVVTGPTGSGKSTQVPRWLGARGRTLVIEPRRVACQSLATRVAALEGTALGDGVGYVVRDERCARSETRILFVTPGIALRMFRAEEHRRFDYVVIDEFHERSLDTDLIYALLVKRGHPTLIVMSATFAAARIAEHLGGQHVACAQREHPVAIGYQADDVQEPSDRNLALRVRHALESLSVDERDVLVFLPGKREIEQTLAALADWPDEVLTLHGELSLAEQRRVFTVTQGPRVVLATNVAETSVTIPRIRAVIDAGLVRRTHYRGGRGYLRLTPIALDSATQRAGRAGRLGPGRCVRLWSEPIRLDTTTPPEIRRESLVPLVLSAAACGSPELDLPFLDTPTEHATVDATRLLHQLGALDEHGAITERGQALFGLPIDAHLGRLLIESVERDTLGWALPLCATLSVTRRFRSANHGGLHRSDESHCDAAFRVNAVLGHDPAPGAVESAALHEARQNATRLRSLFADRAAPSAPFDGQSFLPTLIAAWPDCVHVRRRRGREYAYSNGGTEHVLGRESLIDPEETAALVVLDTAALSRSRSKNALVITAAMPIEFDWMVDLGLGRERLLKARMRAGQLWIATERVYARQAIGRREFAPTGELAREAIRDLILDEQLFSDQWAELQSRHRAQQWKAMVEGADDVPDLARWLVERLTLLGVESGDDIALIEPSDLLPPAIPCDERERLEREFPPRLMLGDATYDVHYAMSERVVTLHQVAGIRKTAPPSGFLPRLPGWRVDWVLKNRRRTIRT